MGYKTIARRSRKLQISNKFQIWFWGFIPPSRDAKPSAFEILDLFFLIFSCSDSQNPEITKGTVGACKKMQKSTDNTISSIR